MELKKENEVTSTILEEKDDNLVKEEILNNSKKNSKLKKSYLALLTALIVGTITLIGAALYISQKPEVYTIEQITGIPQSAISYMIIYKEGDKEGIKTYNLEKFAYNCEYYILGQPAYVNNEGDPIFMEYYDAEDNLLYKDVCCGNYSCVLLNGEKVYYYPR